MAGIPYEITTYTSDKSGASTDADVYIVLYGKDDVTQKKSLCHNKRERKERFKKGAMDKFIVEVRLWSGYTHWCHFLSVCVCEHVCVSVCACVCVCVCVCV